MAVTQLNNKGFYDPDYGNTNSSYGNDIDDSGIEIPVNGGGGGGSSSSSQGSNTTTYKLNASRFNIILDNIVVSQTDSTKSTLTATIWYNFNVIQRKDSPRDTEISTGTTPQYNYDFDIRINVSFVNSKTSEEIPIFRLGDTVNNFYVEPFVTGSVVFSANFYNANLFEHDTNCKLKAYAYTTINNVHYETSPVYSTNFTIQGTVQEVLPPPITNEPTLGIKGILANTEINAEESVTFTPLIYNISSGSKTPIIANNGAQITYKISVSEPDSCEIKYKNGNDFVDATGADITNGTTIQITNNNISSLRKEMSVFIILNSALIEDDYDIGGIVFTIKPIILCEKSQSIIPVPAQFKFTSGSEIIPFNSFVNYEIKAVDRKINELTITKSSELYDVTKNISQDGTTITGRITYPKSGVTAASCQQDTRTNLVLVLKYNDSGVETITKSLKLLKAPAADTFTLKVKIIGKIGDNERAECEYIINDVKLIN